MLADDNWRKVTEHYWVRLNIQGEYSYLSDSFPVLCRLIFSWSTILPHCVHYKFSSNLHFIQRVCYFKKDQTHPMTIKWTKLIWKSQKKAKGLPEIPILHAILKVLDIQVNKNQGKHFFIAARVFGILYNESSARRLMKTQWTVDLIETRTDKQLLLSHLPQSMYVLLKQNSATARRWTNSVLIISSWLWNELKAQIFSL